MTEAGARLSLAGELAAAGQILASAGIQADIYAPDRPLPAVADEVLAPVLREAVTNVLRHSAATTCAVEMMAGDGMLRLRVGNDGVAEGPAAGGPAGRGLANLAARVRAAGGQLTAGQADGRFDLAAEIPLPGTGQSEPGRGAVPGPAPGWPAGSR